MTQKKIIGVIGKPGSGKETAAKEVVKRYGSDATHITFSGPLTQFLLDMGHRDDEIERPLLQRLGQMLVKHFRPDAVTCGVLHLVKRTFEPIIVVDGVRWPSDFAELKNPLNFIQRESGTDGWKRLVRKFYKRRTKDSVREFLLDMDCSGRNIDAELIETTSDLLIKHFGDDFFIPSKKHISETTRDASDSVRCFMVFVDVSPKERFERIKERKQRAGEGDLTWEEFLKQDSAPNEQHIPELAKKADFTIDNEERDPQLKNLRAQVDEFCRKFLNA
ncbi:MAG: hypothetical protein HYT93_01980 [Parcubacteria group bacterium]|nr:hypothetical protein [Parcubacteria group bacterium]